jgi:hypothetical protein
MSVDDGVRLLAREHRLQVVDLDRHPVDPTVAELLPERLAQAYAAVPVGRRYGAPVVAVADPGDLVAMDSLRASLGRDFLPVVASREQIERFIDRLYHGAPGPLAAPGDPDQGPPTDPVTAALVEAL